MPEKNDQLILNGEKVSADTLEPLSTPAPVKGARPYWLRLMLRHPIWTYLIIVGGTGIILSHYWRIVERIAPPLNEFIHREVSDKNDVAYQLYKFGLSQRRYISETDVCYTTNADFATCRSVMLTSKTELADMASRVYKLRAGWQKEVAARPMPQECKDAGTGIYNELAAYVAHEQQVSGVFEAVDPTSEVSVTKAKEQLSQLADVEERSTSRLKNLPKRPSSCAGF